MSVCLRAKKLGLRGGCPDGFEYVSNAAARTGYTATQLRRILRWAGVRVLESYAFVARRGRRHFHIVDALDVDDAISAWHETETLEHAARRLGVSAERVRSVLLARGVELAQATSKRKSHYRIRTADIDAAFAKRVA